MKRVGAAVSESLLVPARVWRAMRDDDHTDAIFTRADQLVLRRAIRRSEAIVHADGGHAVHWEAPERVAEELKAFIRWRVELPLTSGPDAAL